MAKNEQGACFVAIMHRIGDLFLDFYFRFVFDCFTRFYAVKIIENIDTQSSSWSESLKSFWFSLATDCI